LPFVRRERPFFPVDYDMELGEVEILRATER